MVNDKLEWTSFSLCAAKHKIDFSIDFNLSFSCFTANLAIIACF